ncbi:hypothetical protein VTK73DRAFT_3744 [Phialemonium thermophilum]|uniref:RBR-type E3 ubiquitin transferase n=1 Tax=Phialemonium thermophilum TaxID=223376 RepID=A0ABR3WXA3_9PEZI
MDESDDQRDIELSSLSAIFPEIYRLEADDPYTIVLDLPVDPSHDIIVSFSPAASAATLPDGAGGRGLGATRGRDNENDSHTLKHLPPVRLQITLGSGYPATDPPVVSVSTSPSWLPLDIVKSLEAEAPRLWEDMGRDMVLFAYVDHVQQRAEDVFGLVDVNNVLVVDPQHKIAILDYDIKAKRAAFERETFHCGVCLDPKKGAVCHRMLDCGHVFCVACLQDFYNSAIKEGDLATVRCLSPNCAKEREKAATALLPSAGTRKRKKIKTLISPSELLQIPLDPDVVKRYVALKYKTELELDKNTIYCPRTWCNGAARSKKHKKPLELELAEASGESEYEDESDKENEKSVTKSGDQASRQDLLAVCEDCGFAFCSRCYSSWHGPFFLCMPKLDSGDISAEEKASLEYVSFHTTSCPTCGVPCQKTHGCNHMICYRCQSHFCYLCSAWLDPGNPYRHFNEAPDGRITGCYMRLWELEEGDEDGNYAFAGRERQRQPAAAPRPAQAAIPIPEVEEAEEDEEEAAARRAAQEEQRRRNGQDGGEVAFAREGPLVLRIAVNQPAPGTGNAGPPRRQVRADDANAVRGHRRGRAPAQGRRAGRGGPQHGGAGAVRGGRVAENRQVNQQGQRGPPPRRNAGGAAGGGLVVGEADLGALEEAWVRHFVQLALNDQEDVLLDFDLSDHDNDNDD